MGKFTPVKYVLWSKCNEGYYMVVDNHDQQQNDEDNIICVILVHGL